MEQWWTYKFFKNQNLFLNGDDIAILKNIKITGASFLDISKEDLRQEGLQIGPLVAISKLINEINNSK
jgi:hypothetical protein